MYNFCQCTSISLWPTSIPPIAKHPFPSPTSLASSEASGAKAFTKRREDSVESEGTRVESKATSKWVLLLHLKILGSKSAPSKSIPILVVLLFGPKKQASPFVRWLTLVVKPSSGIPEKCLEQLVNIQKGWKGHMLEITTKKPRVFSRRLPCKHQPFNS